LSSETPLTVAERVYTAGHRRPVSPSLDFATLNTNDSNSCAVSPSGGMRAFEPFTAYPPPNQGRTGAAHAMTGNTHTVPLDGDQHNWKPRFFIIWAGQSLSLIGSALTQFILIWWITDTTGSANALATAGIMGLLPQAIFGPFGGILADRYSRRLIMIATDTITALAVVSLMILFATDSIQIWHVYTAMFVRSAMQAFQSPAAMATTSLLVPTAWFARVAAMNQAVGGMMSIAAAPLGAALLAIFPVEQALTLDVVTAVLAVVPLLFFRIPQVMRTDTAQKSVWQDFKDGIHFVTSNRGLFYFFSLILLMVGVLLPSFTLTPLLVRNEFSGGVEQVALMEAMSGLGIILGGFIITLIRLPRRQMTVVLAGYALACLAIAATGLVPSGLFWIAVLLWFLCGILFTFGNTPVVAILQRIIPNQMQGRIFSLLGTVNGFAAPIGLALAAPLAESFGVRAVLVGGGLLACLICLAGFLSPALMRLENE
jgi:DHA3 family macrolide efflux protein-like MFS transporter